MLESVVVTVVAYCNPLVPFRTGRFRRGGTGVAVRCARAAAVGGSSWRELSGVSCLPLVGALLAVPSHLSHEAAWSLTRRKNRGWSQGGRGAGHVSIMLNDRGCLAW